MAVHYATQEEAAKAEKNKAANDGSNDTGGGGGGGGISSLLTASIVVPIILAVIVPLWYKFVIDEGQRDTILAFLVAKGVPASCFDSSPPSSECVNQSFPWIIGIFTSLMVGYTIKTFFFDKPSQAILDVIEQEFDKRHEVLQGLIKELEAGFVADDDDIEVFDFDTVWGPLWALMELPNYDKNLCEECFKWLWIVFQKEFRVVLKLTKAGQDVKFADGVKLQGCLYDYNNLFARAYSQGVGPRGEQRKELYRLKLEASSYLRVHWIKTIVKAGKMALLAKEAFPWLVLQTIGITLTAMLVPLKLHYRAQVLENLADTEASEFWDASKAMVLVELLSTVLNLLTDMIKVQAETLANREIQVKYYDSLLKMPVTFWARQSDMGRWDRIGFWDVYQFDYQVTRFLAIPQNVLQQMVQAITYAYIILNTSSQSLLLLLGAQFGSSILQWFLEKLTRRLEAMSQQGVVNQSHEDFMCCRYSLEPDYISTFLSFVRGPKECKRFEKMKIAAAEHQKRRNFVKVFSSPVNAAVAQGSEVVQFSTARANVLQQGLGIADADAMVRSAGNFVEQTQSVRRTFNEVVQTAFPLAKAYDIITIPKTIDPDTGLWPKEKAKGLIEFKDVRFKYPRRDAEVLKGVTLTVRPGDSIGMTGSAGCGKSTCMRLLERFYDVTSGSVLLDGIDIREYNPRWLRSQIATVAQEPKLIPMSLRENLTFGCSKEPSLDEIYDALKAANIYDAIMDKSKFPQGVRTSIESAGNVSGGEKQRIAIARAILADPPILLLDEATSALDEENQAKVQDALDKLMKGRTTMVIAHRLSTIKNSSKIVAFDKGKVFEEGTHDELLNKEGSLYSKLWNRQTSKRLSSDDEEDEEEEKVEPLEVEAGMNPKPTALKRFTTLLQDMDDSDPIKREFQKVHSMFEAEQKGREICRRGIQRTALSKWQAQVARSSASENQSHGSKNFQRLANKVIFKNLHSDVTERLEHYGGEDD